MAAMALTACGSKDGAAGAQGAAGGASGAAAGPPPPEVGIVTVALRSVGLTTELPGRLEASRVAQVRARAAGILQQRLFREGSDVKAGQALFRIDDAPYRATYQSAQAALARAQANLSQASAQAERYKPLVEANAISKQDYVNAVAAQAQAQADVASGKAALQTAQINLGYASVVSPIGGRIGRALVTEGALVGQGEAT
ncbi:MAG TPA: efflux RND transporter periplasmic adaptor subunit, partial [Albitalea sp.]|nr:efflux RND transporter periplasmic adaptor subunit [Albitalea sp.]